MQESKNPYQNEKRYQSYSEYLKGIFGSRVQKLSIDAGFTCPNRDGSIGRGGCIYCNNEGFSPSYCHAAKSITQQIQEGIEFHSVRYRRAQQYLAYFQSYTNTYASVEKLEKMYNEALSFNDVAGLVIGTRPDCVNNEILDLIERISKKVYVIIEYGVETTNEETLITINRGHSYQLAKEIIHETARRNIKTGAHFIINLPGEPANTFIQQIDEISALPLTSIKFHQLQVLRNTVLEKKYKSDPSIFKPITLEEYLDIIIEIVEHLNPNIVIERIASEVPPRHLVAGNWGLIRYTEVARLFENKMAEKNTWQGKYYKK